jgi:hypothetical protein
MLMLLVRNNIQIPFKADSPRETRVLSMHTIIQTFIFRAGPDLQDVTP